MTTLPTAAALLARIRQQQETMQKRGVLLQGLLNSFYDKCEVNQPREAELLRASVHDCIDMLLDDAQSMYTGIRLMQEATDAENLNKKNNPK